MFKKILCPVDLTHAEQLSKALDLADNLAKSSGAEICFVGIHGATPSTSVHKEKEYREKLEEFAASEASKRGVTISAHSYYSHDPRIDIAPAVIETVATTGADAVVMASHIPGWMEHIFHSNAGYVACHAPVSVFVVR